MIMIHEGRKAIDLSGTWKYRYETEKNVLYVNGKKVHDYPQSVAGKLELNGGK